MADPAPRLIVEDWKIPHEIFVENDKEGEDPFFEELRDDHYNHLYRWVKEWGIRSVLEIGVKAGYGLFSFCSANPKLRYCGIELCKEGHRFARNAQELAGLFPDARFEFLWGTRSTDLDVLPGSRWDLIYIDGEHTAEAVFSDLELSARYADQILLDDCIMEGVVNGVGPWIVRQYGKGLRVPHEYFRTKHGHLLIDVAEITE